MVGGACYLLHVCFMAYAVLSHLLDFLVGIALEREWKEGDDIY